MHAGAMRFCITSVANAADVGGIRVWDEQSPLRRRYRHLPHFIKEVRYHGTESSRIH